MEGLQLTMDILTAIWHGFFSLEWPGIGLTVAQVFVGAFVVFISMRILWSLLGLGAGAVKMLGRSRSRSRRSRSNSSSEKGE